MAQSAVALLCLSSLLAWDDAVVIPCDHPASPFARSAPPIAVPPIRTVGVEGLTPDLAEEAAKQHEHKPSAAKGGAAQHGHKPSAAKGGAARHEHKPSAAKASAPQPEHNPSAAKGGAAQHRRQPSSTNGGVHQHRH